MENVSNELLRKYYNLYSKEMYKKRYKRKIPLGIRCPQEKAKNYLDRVYIDQDGNMFKGYLARKNYRWKYIGKKIEV